MSYGLKKKTFQAVRGLQGLVGHYTKGQKLVAEAVDPKFAWGPETALMDKIAELTRDHEECRAILEMIWEVIGNTASKKWKKVYKALLLLEHLLTYASEGCVRQIQDNVYRVRALSNYIYKDKNGNDQGVNVRKRSAIVADLATDEDLKDVRARALENKSRYQGMSSTSSGGFGYYGSSSSSSSSSGSGYSSGYSGYSGSAQSGSGHSHTAARSYDSFVEQPPPADLVQQSQQAQPRQQAPAPAPVPAPQQPQPQPQQVFGGWGAPAPQAQAQVQVQAQPQPVDLWGAPAQPPAAPSQPLIDLFGTAPAQPPQPAPAAPAVALPPMNSAAQAQQQRQADPLADLFGSPAPAAQPASQAYGAGSRPLERAQPKSPLDSLFDM